MKFITRIALLMTCGIPCYSHAAVNTESKFSGSFSAAHSVYAKSDIDPNSSFTMSAAYRVQDDLTLGFSQSATKMYEINEDDNELLLSDAEVYASYRLQQPEDNDLGLGFTVRGRATLSFSEFSAEQKVVSVPGISVSASKEIQDLVSLTITPYYYYHINSYQTLDQDEGGAYFVQQRYGASLSLGLDLPANFYFSASSSYQERRYENTAILPKHSYSFSAELSYQIQKNLGLAAGYSQSDLAEKYGTVDINLYDIEVASYYGSLAYSF